MLFEVVVRNTINRFIRREAQLVEVGEWQAILGNTVFTRTYELEDIYFYTPVPTGREEWAEIVKPHLPWAEDQFQERISGKPLNPPPSHEWWPFNVKKNELHIKQGKFSHSYPERFWPKFASADENPDNRPTGEGGSNRGIRYRYGDFGDLIHLLKSRPYTRQAYLPIWFPEDTGGHHGERVPCTLGYHFLRRENQMKIVYFMRSCDFIRYFKDDVYMAGRLLQEVCNSLELEGVIPSQLVMYISSLHIFEADLSKLGKERTLP